MMNKLTTFVCCLFCCLQLSTITKAQELLSMDEVLLAIEENNYDLKAAQQNIAAAKALTTKYNRGYLPTLGIDAGLGFTLSGIKSVFNIEPFPDLNVQNIAAYNGNVGIGSSYLIYDGGQRKLRNKKNLTNLDNTKLQVNNIKQVISFNAAQIYYRIVQAMFNNNLLQETLAISKERNKRAQTFYEYGKANRVDISNAKVDIIRDSLNIISTKNNIENFKWQLNQLTLRQDIDFTADTTFTLFYQLLKREDLQATLRKSNTELIALQQNIALVKYDLAIAHKLNAPQISANGGYNFSYQKNDAKAQEDHRRTNGLNLGLNANWNILDGGQQKLQEQLASIDLQNASIAYKNKENELSAQLNQLWNNYQNNLLTLRIEKQNIQLNKENFELVKTRYENGQQSSVEFRQAQLNLLNAQSQYYITRTSAKLLEVEVGFLLGE